MAPSTYFSEDQKQASVGDKTPQATSTFCTLPPLLSTEAVQDDDETTTHTLARVIVLLEQDLHRLRTTHATGSSALTHKDHATSVSNVAAVSAPPQVDAIDWTRLYHDCFSLAVLI